MREIIGSDHTFGYRFSNDRMYGDIKTAVKYLSVLAAGIAISGLGGLIGVTIEGGANAKQMYTIIAFFAAAVLVASIANFLFAGYRSAINNRTLKTSHVEFDKKSFEALKDNIMNSIGNPIIQSSPNAAEPSADDYRIGEIIQQHRITEKALNKDLFTVNTELFNRGRTRNTTIMVSIFGACSTIALLNAGTAFTVVGNLDIGIPLLVAGFMVFCACLAFFIAYKCARNTLKIKEEESKRFNDHESIDETWEYLEEEEVTQITDTLEKSDSGLESGSEPLYDQPYESSQSFSSQDMDNGQYYDPKEHIYNEISNLNNYTIQGNVKNSKQEETALKYDHLSSFSPFKPSSLAAKSETDSGNSFPTSESSSLTAKSETDSGSSFPTSKPSSFTAKSEIDSEKAPTSKRNMSANDLELARKMLKIPPEQEGIASETRFAGISKSRIANKKTPVLHPVGIPTVPIESNEQTQPQERNANSQKNINERGSPSTTLQNSSAMFIDTSPIAQRG